MVSIYVERSYRPRAKPSGRDIGEYAARVRAELEQWGWLKDVQIQSSNWIPLAYTWTLPGSKWRQEAIDSMARSQILMSGRYATWKFQGMAECIQDGLRAGAALRMTAGTLTGA
jgi:hypothetical protein